jgi:hypothetical protein
MQGLDRLSPSNNGRADDRWMTLSIGCPTMEGGGQVALVPEQARTAETLHEDITQRG